jgi:DNA-binding LytR/AlgR family response regulator
VPPLKALIADDEPELRAYLKLRLAEVWPELLISGEAGNGQEALRIIETSPPDIAFLDIRMPGLSGMEVARKVAGKCRVVFITAYDQYAVQAFENQALDYLLKPVTADRLQRTVQRLKKELSLPALPPPDLSEIIKKIMGHWPPREAPDYLKWIRVQEKDEIRLIPMDEIRYFQAEDKYTLVITSSGESLIRKPIKELVQELDPGIFWQIHRGIIVNVTSIDKVNRSFSGRLNIKLKDLSKTLTVSRSYSHRFRQM